MDSSGPVPSRPVPYFGNCIAANCVGARAPAAAAAGAARPKSSLNSSQSFESKSAPHRHKLGLTARKIARAHFHFSLVARLTLLEALFAVCADELTQTFPKHIFPSK